MTENNTQQPFQDLTKQAQSQPGQLHGLLAPIQDSGQSPTVSLFNKKAEAISHSASPREAGDNQVFRNHQVNYSFGQQPFKELQKSQRFQNTSEKNSMIANSGPGTFRTNPNVGSYSGAQPMVGTYNNASSVSGSNAGNSKGQKSAVSMASVMGQFDNLPSHTNGVPNIFAQSLQRAEGKPPARGTKPSKNASNGTDNEKPMRQTQKDFNMTASRVESVEKIVSEGLQKNADRQSQHSLEAANMGLRKSQDGRYESEEASRSMTQLANHAKIVTQAAVQTVMTETKVPQDIRAQMIQQGFRPSSKQDGQFEYESDTIEKYEMISNEFDYEQVRKGDNFGIKQYKDCIYRGQLNENRQREGLGVLVYHNGRVYEGEWKQNKRSGRGYEVFSNGNSYHGTYEDGKANGKGVYQWQNGEVYDGEWMRGIKHGYGVWKGTNGESYIGQWVSSKAQGYGVHVFANGDKYEGEWHACLRQGNGSDFFANGDCYVGQYNQGKPEGFGQYKWSNGSSYTGQFLNGLKNGHGKWKKKQADEFGNTKCNSYEGMYFADKKHGFGVFEWESGNRYEGNYAEDERHGYGVMKWTDESKYMGMWDQGIQHGIGVMIFPDGVRRAGIFEENVFKESLKKKEQLDPYREMLQDDCLQILEDLLAKRVQSKANLFAPLNRSKAEIAQRERSFQSNQANGEPIADSSSHLARERSESRQQSFKMSGYIDNSAVNNFNNDAISDNASYLNQPMRDADREDYTQTMQRAHPMRESIAASSKHQSSIQKIQNEPGLPPMPLTSQGKPTNAPGRTIEVQTDLSMVTMEQYSQGYNSKAFMNKTQGFLNKTSGDKDEISQGSPTMQSNMNFQKVLSKAQFRNTKHNQEILGGDNPINDSESEWNRGGGSSMMVNQQMPAIMNATTSTMQQKPPVARTNNQSNLISQQQRRQLGQVKGSLGRGERRLRSNDPPQSRGGYPKGQSNYTSPYGQQNIVASKSNQGRQKPLSNPRMNKSQLQMDRRDREHNNSMPLRQQNRHAMGQNNFMITPDIPAAHGKFANEANRNHALNLLGEQGQFHNQTEINSKKPPQKMFQSQYGASRFNNNAIFQQPKAQPPPPLPPPQYYNQQHTQSMLMNYPQHMGIMETPVQQVMRNYQLPNSEQQQPLSSSFPIIAGANRSQTVHETPVQHMNLKLGGLGAGYPQQNLKHYVSNFRTYDPPVREDVLTPSPKSMNDYHSTHFSRPARQEVDPKEQNTNGFGDMNISENANNRIAVEPMFGQGANDYYSDARPAADFGGNNSDGQQEAGFQGENFRGKTSTSSQRTLRYNDFELVQKIAQNDPKFELHVDEGDNKDSFRVPPDVHNRKEQDYQDFKMQRLYESNQGPVLGGEKNNQLVATNARNSRQSLPKVVGSLNHSIQQARKGADKRRHLNSNDTELAHTTMNLQASEQSSPAMMNLGVQSSGRHVILPNNRIVQRSSLPPSNNHSKISVNKGFHIEQQDGVNLSRVHPGSNPNGMKNQISPKPNYKFVGTKSKKNSVNRDGSNSNSRSRFDFVGPYAQNLKKPKLFEAKSGVQKIALKNHIASLQQQNMKTLAQKHMSVGNGPFNSEVFSKKRSSFGSNMHEFQQQNSVDDRDNKHSHRFASHGRNEGQSSGNFVIQHKSLVHNPNGNNGVSLPPMGSQSQMSRIDNSKNKRVWVPYNKKMKLKGMQQNMQVAGANHSRTQAQNNNGSYISTNPLLNSND